MLDFLQISTRSSKRGVVEIYPKFIIRKSNDLMIRGGDFYAIWLDERGEWSTDEDDALQLIDKYLDDEYEKSKDKYGDQIIKVLHMWDSENRMIASWHRYCREDMRDHFTELDGKIIFANDKVSKRDYASKRLTYPLQEGSIECYDRLMSVLYSPDERAKIEWAIGSIVTGDSKKIQKFLVLYGSSGTGKSTVLNIIQQLFDGYYSTFDAKALGSASASFALEAFKDNPLVAIQHDGDLSRIEDNTRINSLSSHELMTVNEKFKSAYTQKFRSFMFMGTNKPVKITDAKSGLIRRLIDVTPTGNKVPPREYKDIMNKIKFELGAIAWHCKEFYLSDPGRYDNYIPLNMMGASNDFYNFVMDSYFVFEREDSVALKVAWEMYNSYCESAKVPYPFPQRQFKEELKNYFNNFEERGILQDGSRVRSYYSGFKKEIFEYPVKKPAEEIPKSWIDLKKQPSILDDVFAEYPAQYANKDGIPERKWDFVKTKLKDLDTHKIHYVGGLPDNYIFVDFDLKAENGEKSRERNLEEASKWPVTYCELSKGEAGVHLHYIYDGDPSKLDQNFAEGIEIKVPKGNSALRRKLTLCTNDQIAHLSSGLPIKEEVKKIVSTKRITSEKGLRRQIERNLKKEIHGYTKPSIDMIKKILDDAYEDGLQYDVSDLEDALIEFAMSSSNNAVYCLNVVHNMKLKSEQIMAPPEEPKDDAIIFFDCEVFPNLFLINWKKEGPDNKVVRMINPTSDAVSILAENKLVGFNCRRYDNHILYARILGENNEQLYKRSQAIISGDRSAFFGDAYNLSYTDIYDFSAKKQSLKKFEIELAKEHDERMAKIHKFLDNGESLDYISKEMNVDKALVEKWLYDEEHNVNVVQHKELGLPWDQPVPEEKWVEVAEYCDADVLATEAVWNARKGDFVAREILAALAGMSVNDTTNSLTTKIIFGGNRTPQDQFNYRNMGVQANTDWIPEGFDKYTCFDSFGRPVFPGYIYDHGKSIYRDIEVGEGGYVYAEPGIYGNVALLDVASLHPSTIVAENLFGPFTENFNDILKARIAIKHKDFDTARTMLGGKLAPFLTDEKQAKALAQALKIAINSVYGLTSAKFDNPFRDKRNKDNIVAKRGALFMINLQHEVQKRGFTVAHIKTDSIKIPDATPEIIQFVMDYGKMYGYTFEHEDTYERMCLVNDAVYIAKSQDGHWSPTGTQFQVPYVFKTLFSKEEIIFDDLCETKAVSGDSAIYLDMNEGMPDVSEYEKELEKIEKELKKLWGSEWKAQLEIMASVNADVINERFGIGEDKIQLSNDLIRKYWRLEEEIAKGHNYIFVGRVGRFTPVVEGCGGGVLYRKKDDKYYAVTGTKGFKWMESGMVKVLGKEDCVDYKYYEELVDEAVETIRKYGAIEDERHGMNDWFFSEVPYKKCTYTNGIPDRYYRLN